MAFNNYYSNPYFQQPNYYNNNGASPDMLNQMKGQYQPQMVQPIPQVNLQPTPMSPTNQNTNNNDIIWVQGLEGAKSFLVAPNNTVTLWDSESQTIYLKTADMNGVPSMRVLDFTERVANTPKTSTERIYQYDGKFATLEQFESLQAKISELQSIIEELQTKSTTKSTKTTKKTEVE